jgi:hypothetical protein
MKINYETYQSLNDCQLLDLILLGDMSASFYLISLRYQKVLHKIIGEYLKKLRKKISDLTEQEYWLYKFQNYMDSPTKIAGKSRFEGIEHKDNLKSWLCGCCNVFLKKHMDTDANYDINREVPDTNDYDMMESESEEHHLNMMKQEMRDYFFIFLSDRDAFIMYTYLYYIQKRIFIVHLDEKITDVLINHGCPNMTADHVRKIKNKSLAKARNFFSKIKHNDINNKKSKTKDKYEMKKDFVAENKNLSDEEDIIKKREVIMQLLGIERDFITDMMEKEKTN